MCLQCGRQFDTIARLRTHAANAHEYRSPLALRVYTAQCLCCSTVFHTRACVIRHLRRNGGQNECAAWYLDSVEPMEAADLLKVEAADRAAARATSAKDVLPPPVRILA